MLVYRERASASCTALMHRLRLRPQRTRLMIVPLESELSLCHTSILSS